MSRWYVGLFGPKCSAMVGREGCLFSSAERALSRSQSCRAIQRSGSSSVKAYGGTVLAGPALGQRSSQYLPSVRMPMRTRPCFSDCAR